VLAAGDALSVRDLAVDGSDLMRELGLPPGKGIGVLLGELLERVTEEPARNEPAALLAIARQIVAARGMD
jgi:tRNA nucleotidyltransferase (CCA-adding enzyme)